MEKLLSFNHDPFDKYFIKCPLCAEHWVQAEDTVLKENDKAYAFIK